MQDAIKLNENEIADKLSRLRGWDVINGHHLYRRWQFKDFAEPLKLVSRIGKVAEEMGHHPDIKFSWGYLEIIIYTHSIDGLSENDLILADKVDKII